MLSRQTIPKVHYCLLNDGFMSGRCCFFTRNWMQKTCSKGFDVVYLVYNHVSGKTVLDFYPLPLPRAASPPCPPLHRCSLVLGLTSGQSRRWRTFRPSIGTGQVPTFPLVGRSEARQSPKCSKVSVGPCCLFFKKKLWLSVLPSGTEERVPAHGSVVTYTSSVCGQEYYAC